MPSTDAWTLIFIHFVLALLLILSIVGEIAAYLRKRRGAAKLTVERGDRSMNALYVLYGVATVAYSLAIDVSTFGVGHKTTIVILDYIIFTYLFFFNSWFRNSIVFKALIKISKD